MDLENRDVHFCATCQHLRHERRGKFVCARLGYETRPRWKFNCWSPRPKFRQEDNAKDQKP